MLRRSWLALLMPLFASSAPASITVTRDERMIEVKWPDDQARLWTATFSLDPAKPVIQSIEVAGKKIIENARPFYSCSVGTRRGGWDQFANLPPAEPEGTSSFVAAYRTGAANVTKRGDRAQIDFSGLKMGPFTGSLRYTFYPGSRLLHQEAVVQVSGKDVAYIYDAGLRMTAHEDLLTGRHRMKSSVSFFDTTGQLRTVTSGGPQRNRERVRYRAVAANLPDGSVAVFPEPHRYFFPRDFTTNLGNVWHNAWDGLISIGIRHEPDDDTFSSPAYPWINAPEGTEQRMGVFFLLSDDTAEKALGDVLRYSNSDRFPALSGYQTLSTHFHFHYTVQATANGPEWVPPFKAILQAMGLNAAALMDFHGDGHPRDTSAVRLGELKEYYQACRRWSDASFLLIPAEEANVYLGGHWGLIFPKPVYWFMDHATGLPFQDGNVYRVGDATELAEMVKREDAFLFQTHPRSKASQGYPDRNFDAPHFRDDHFFGAGWKAMNADLSSPRLGDRAFKLLDEMSNRGIRKRLIGETDIFQIDPSDELWGHMNTNYVRMPKLPDFDNYGMILCALSRGEFFVTTGEVLLPQTSLSLDSDGGIKVTATVQWTYPLQFAEVVWGDGRDVFREILGLESTRQFAASSFAWSVRAPEWKWARLAVWDVAGNGAFVNPTWR